MPSARRRLVSPRCRAAAPALLSGALWCLAGTPSGPGFVGLRSQPPRLGSAGAGVRGGLCGERTSSTPPRIARCSFQGRPGGSPGGFGGGPPEEPQWLGTAFFGLIILSFIPGPWQVVLGPIISIINAFYIFKFLLFLLPVVAIFGLQWYIDFTTTEGQCPRCGTPQRGSKNDPFNCAMCGEDLEVKDGQFVKYIKSGKVSSAFDQIGDFVKEAAAKAPVQTEKKTPPSSSPSKPKKDVDVVDVEVL